MADTAYSGSVNQLRLLCLLCLFSDVSVESTVFVLFVLSVVFIVLAKNQVFGYLIEFGWSYVADIAYSGCVSLLFLLIQLFLLLLLFSLFQLFQLIQLYGFLFLFQTEICPLFAVDALVPGVVAAAAAAVGAFAVDRDRQPCCYCCSRQKLVHYSC